MDCNYKNMTAILQRPTHLDAHAEGYTGTPMNHPRLADSMAPPTQRVETLLENIRQGAMIASSTDPMRPPSQAVLDTLKKI